jgi:hypothetical protein
MKVAKLTNEASNDSFFIVMNFFRVALPQGAELV